MSELGVLVAWLVVAAATAARAATRRSTAGRARLRLVPAARRVAAVSVPAWFVRVAERHGATERVAPTVLWNGSLVAAAASVLAGWLFGGSAGAAASAVLAASTALVLLRAQRRKVESQYDDALAELLERVAGGLRAGASLPVALVESADEVQADLLARDIRELLARSQIGVSLASALDAWSARRPFAAVRLASAAMALGAETGGAQAVALDGVARTIRQRAGAIADARALAAQGRLSAWLMAALPVMFSVLMTGMQAGAKEFLFHTPAGLVCLAAGVALEACGLLWMNRLVRIDV